MLRHVALSESLQVSAKFTEINLRIYGPQVVTAAYTLARHPTSKIAKENLEVFADMWQWLMTDVTTVAKDVLELNQNRPEKQVYMSLPRPGKHGTTSKPLKPVKLDSEEQAKIAKAGLEMKLITSEMDAETEKWQESGSALEENNDIVKRAKNMSSMAFSMYQFTRGEGALKTTQDLFTQAEYFAEEANRLYKVVRQFSYQSPQQEDWDSSTAFSALKHFERLVETTRMTLLGPGCRETLTAALDTVIERTQDFTDSAYTSHEHRENILLLCDRAQLELNTLLRIGNSMNYEGGGGSPSSEMEQAVLGVLRTTRDLRQQLCTTTMEQAADLGQVTKAGQELVSTIRNVALANDRYLLQESNEKFREYIEHILEVSVSAIKSF